MNPDRDSALLGESGRGDFRLARGNCPHNSGRCDGNDRGITGAPLDQAADLTVSLGRYQGAQRVRVSRTQHQFAPRQNEVGLRHLDREGGEQTGAGRDLNHRAPGRQSGNDAVGIYRRDLRLDGFP